MLQEPLGGDVGVAPTRGVHHRGQETLMGLGKRQAEPSPAGWRAGAAVSGTVASRLLGGVE